ncbi:MAG: hypothetical protein DI534_03010 [Leifsonia xyli]|nr:MAG: hypothetical protein DI534_03010 [Leifsonia xyli]
MLIAVALASMLIIAGTNPEPSGGFGDGILGNVTSTIDGDEAVIDGSTTTPGSTGSGGGSGGGGTGASAPAPGAAPTTPRCGDLDPTCDSRDDFDVIVVTLNDIARFRPTPGVQRMEPDGWVVVGLPANIYSLVDPQVVPGELLGQPAEVRFTPVAWNWNYGDGDAATRTTKGGTWSALGLREFDATPTSHTYLRNGSYTIRLTITYRAEYRFAGGPFVPIAGTITLPANELNITAGGAKTVLVDRDCTRAPAGPGC